MAKRRILIAEDDTVLRDLYIRKFDTNLYEISTASDGQQALTMIQQNPPEMLLLDINMPVLDGFGVLSALPKDKRTFKVIILTNFGDQVNRDRGKEFGVDEYFVKKDMTIKSLLEMVERLLGK